MTINLTELKAGDIVHFATGTEAVVHAASNSGPITTIYFENPGGYVGQGFQYYSNGCRAELPEPPYTIVRVTPCNTAEPRKERNTEEINKLWLKLQNLPGSKLYTPDEDNYMYVYGVGPVRFKFDGSPVYFNTRDEAYAAWDSLTEDERELLK